MFLPSYTLRPTAAVLLGAALLAGCTGGNDGGSANGKHRESAGASGTAPTRTPVSGSGNAASSLIAKGPGPQAHYTVQAQPAPQHVPLPHRPRPAPAGRLLHPGRAEPGRHSGDAEDHRVPHHRLHLEDPAAGARHQRREDRQRPLLRLHREPARRRVRPPDLPGTRWRSQRCQESVNRTPFARAPARQRAQQPQGRRGESAAHGVVRGAGHARPGSAGHRHRLDHRPGHPPPHVNGIPWAARTRPDTSPGRGGCSGRPGGRGHGGTVMVRGLRGPDETEARAPAYADT